MKQCPVCKTTYSDDSLAFCLSDGTSLISTSEPPPTQIMAFGKMKVEIPSNLPYLSNPTVISTPKAVPKSSRGLIFVLLTIGSLLLLGVAGLAAFLFYNDRGFDKKEVAVNNSPLPSKNEDNTQQLKDRLANLEKQLDSQKNAKPSPSATSVAPPSQSDSSSVPKNAKVGSTNDGFLAMRSAPSTEDGEQIIKIPTGAIVELRSCTRNYITVSGRLGQWCVVSYGGKTGWAFDGWLIY